MNIALNNAGLAKALQQIQINPLLKLFEAPVGIYSTSSAADYVRMTYAYIAAPNEYVAASEAEEFVSAAYQSEGQFFRSVRRPNVLNPNDFDMSGVA